MAKDDYNYIVYRILLYLYGCLKRKYRFDKTVFDKTIGAEDLDPGYLTDVLRLMGGDGLITGVTFVKAWGSEYILESDISEMAITSSGIQYLTDNGKMKNFTEGLKSGAGLIAELVRTVL